MSVANANKIFANVGPTLKAAASTEGGKCFMVVGGAAGMVRFQFLAAFYNTEDYPVYGITAY